MTHAHYKYLFLNNFKKSHIFELYVATQKKKKRIFVINSYHLKFYSQYLKILIIILN